MIVILRMVRMVTITIIATDVAVAFHPDVMIWEVQLACKELCDRSRKHLGRNVQFNVKVTAVMQRRCEVQLSTALCWRAMIMRNHMK